MQFRYSTIGPLLYNNRNLQLVAAIFRVLSKHLLRRKSRLVFVFLLFLPIIWWILNIFHVISTQEEAKMPMNGIEPENDSKNGRHLVLITAVYSAKSKIYQDNTIVMLLNAPLTSNEHLPIGAVIRNATDQFRTEFTLSRAFPIIVECSWNGYLAALNSVEQPDSLEIVHGGKTLPIRLTRPFNERTAHVGTCFSPLFFAEHWQQLIMSIEIYRHFGAHLQMVYMMSAVGGILQLLELYDDVVQVEPWYSLQMDRRDRYRIGMDPNLELDWRNQAMAHTHCLLKYREAAEFLIVGDLDDVLIPDSAGTFFEEFVKNDYKTKNGAALLYTRFPAEIGTTSDGTEYSMLDDLKTARVSMYQPDDPKYVVNSSRVYTLWLHHPGIVLPGTKVKKMTVRQGRMFHFRKWTIRKGGEEETEAENAAKRKADTGDDAETTDKSPPNMSNSSVWAGIPLLGSFLNAQTAAKISAKVVKMMEKHYGIFLKLPRQQRYTTTFTKCYDRIFYGNDKQVTACPTPHRCRFNKLAGQKCHVAKRYFYGHQLSSNLTIYTSPNPAEFHLAKDGCSFY